MTTSALLPLAHPELLTAQLSLGVLFDRAPQPEEIGAALSDNLGPRITSLSHGPTVGEVAAVLDQNFQLQVHLVAPSPAPIHIHPVLSASAQLDQYTRAAAARVTISPDPQISPLTQAFVQPRLGQYLALVHAVASILQVPGAVAVDHMPGKATIAAGTFIAGVNTATGAHTMAPVWLAPADPQHPESGLIDGFSRGLVELGHPEVQIRHWSGDPTDLYYRLVDIVSYITAGQPLKAGDTLAASADAPSHTVVAAPWLADPTVPALELQQPDTGEVSSADDALSS